LICCSVEGPSFDVYMFGWEEVFGRGRVEIRFEIAEKNSVVLIVGKDQPFVDTAIVDVVMAIFSVLFDDIS